MAFILGAKDVLVCAGNQYSEISSIFWKLLKERVIASKITMQGRINQSILAPKIREKIARKKAVFFQNF